MRDPSPSSVLVTLTPLTVTPLVESRSSMDKPMSLPWGQTLIRAWRREIPGSLMRMSASDPRPIVSPGGGEGMAHPVDFQHERCTPI